MTARTTCADLIAELRVMGDAGTADFTVGNSSYWTDAHLQTILDAHRSYVNHESVDPIDNNGTVVTYTMFPTGRNWWEDTIVVQESGGGTIGTAGYSTDLFTGLITFTANQAGSARFVTGYVYDLYSCAADVWSKKAAHWAARYDVATDNHSLKRSQLVAQARAMAAQYRDMAMAGVSVTMDRVD